MPIATFVLILVALGVVGAIAGIAYLHGHKNGIESAAARMLTVPAGVQSEIDAAVPAAGNKLQQASAAAQKTVTDAVEKAASI